MIFIKIEKEQFGETVNGPSNYLYKFYCAYRTEKNKNKIQIFFDKYRSGGYRIETNLKTLNTLALSINC